MFERDRELARLRSLLSGALEGSGRVVLIRGEAGMGKTTLLQAFADSIAPPTRVLTGHCDDLATPRELGPLWDMGRDEPTLMAAMTGADRTQTYAAALDLIGGTTPTVLLMEDVHWADGATLDLIKVIGRRIDHTTSLLVLTARDDEPESDHRLRPVIGDIPPHAVERIGLGPLSLEAVERMAEGHGRDASRLLADSGGNPFYLSEMLAGVDGEVPASVQDATRSRAARLSPPARELLELVSVVPGGRPRSLVEMVDGWEAALDEAVERGLLTFDGTAATFRHELARRAIEASLPAARRRELNHAVLRSLIERDAPPAQIVHHAVEAGDVSAIVEHAPLAAARATAADSHAEAAAHYRRLAPHLDRFEPGRRAELLEAWSQSELSAAEVGRSLDLARRAVALRRAGADEAALGRAARWLSRAAWNAGQRAEAEQAASEAVTLLERSGSAEDLAAAYSASAQLDMLAFHFGAAVEKADLAIALADEAGTDRVRAHALINKGSALTIADQVDGDRILVDGIELAARLGLHDEAVRGLINRSWASLSNRRLSEALERVEAAIATAFEHDAVALEVYGHATRGLISVFTGDWFAVEDLTPELENVDQSRARVVLLPSIGTVRARRGAPDARALLEEGWALAAPSQELQRTGYAAVALAELAWIEDRLDTVPSLVLPLLDEALAVESPWMAGALAYWAWKAGAISDVPEGLAEPSTDQIAGRWRQAAQGWAELGMPYERALALAEGDRPARLRALTILDELGADAVAAKLRAELRADGVRSLPRGPRRATRANPAGLTARQVEVLQHLAEGWTNPEIADRLFVSPRTVDHHVSAVLAKLVVASRDEAVAAGRRLGILGGESAP